MRKHLFAPAALLVCAGALAAQTTFVSPARSASIDAYSSSSYPFRNSSVATGRYQSYMEIHDLPSTAKGKLSGIALRREGFNTGSNWYDDPSPAITADMEIRVSTSVNTAATMVSTLASNHGADKTTVLKRAKVNFKSIPRIPNVLAQPFLFKFPFDSGSTLAFAGGKSLAYEVEIFDHDLYDQQNSTYKYIYFDRDYNTTSGRSQQNGRACYGSNTASVLPYYSYWYSSYYSTTNVLRMYGYAYNGVSGGVSVALLSGGLLPAALKLPGDCWLYIDPAKIFMTVPGTGLTSSASKSTTHYIPPYIANNTSRQYLDIPWDPKFAGAQMEVQTLGIDPTANSLGLTLSNNNTVFVPNYSTNGLPVSYGYRYQSGTNFYEYAYKDQGNVTQFLFN
ncbi:MAG: hypothetical protein R3F30_08505 [Planctomycetota bacterium]